MCGSTGLVVWTILWAFLESCGAPAVSLSFGGKSKNDSGVVFAYKNGSWVPLGSKIHSVKSVSQVKNDEKMNYSSELDDLFKRLNLTVPRKMASNVMSSTRGTSEKPLGELFLEWLSKHEGPVKPVAIKSTAIPVVGLQIDFDEGPPGKVTGRDLVTSHPKMSLVSSFGEARFLFGQPMKKNPKSFESPGKPRVRKRHGNPFDRPINYLDSEIGQDVSNSEDMTISNSRKRRGQYNDPELKFIIEPLTISPFELVKSDLEDSSNFYFQSNMTKREVTSSNLRRVTVAPRELVERGVLHVRPPRSYIDLFTSVIPVKAQSDRPADKIPKFDDALPIMSHVKKRHNSLFMNSKLEMKNDQKIHTPIPAAEESYSGQLLVRNEIPSDRKNKLNDLPKYVMKFLSQCKALIEQNYDDDNGKDYDDDEALLVRSSQNASAGDQGRVVSKSATDRATSVTRVTAVNADVDEFESISINKKPMKKKNRIDKGSIKISIDSGGESGMESKWPPNEHSKLRNGVQSSVGSPNVPSMYDGDDLYDEELDWHLGDNNQEEKVNRKTYFTSESNSSTCHPIFEDYAPSSDIYTPDCNDEPQVTTLSSEQWKVLMDMLNERLPTSNCATTCSTKKTTRKADVTTNYETPKITSSKQKIDFFKFGNSKTTLDATTLQTSTTCKTSQATGSSTTTCATTTSCSTTTTCPTTTSFATTTTFATTQTTETTCAPDSETVTTTEECVEQNTPMNIKQKHKPAAPQRYLIKIETSRPKHYNELSHLQGRAKPNNWFDNIKNLKLLEGLRLNQAPLKPDYNLLNPKSAHGDPENPERMIAEGVIPLKTGSTLNLYISYVLNKTKAHKAPLTGSNYLDDNLPEAPVPRKPLRSSKVFADRGENSARI